MSRAVYTREKKSDLYYLIFYRFSLKYDPVEFLVGKEYFSNFVLAKSTRVRACQDLFTLDIEIRNGRNIVRSSLEKHEIATDKSSPMRVNYSSTFSVHLYSRLSYILTIRWNSK